MHTLKSANEQLDSRVFNFSPIEHQDKVVKHYTGFSIGLIRLSMWNGDRMRIGLSVALEAYQYAFGLFTLCPHVDVKNRNNCQVRFP